MMNLLIEHSLALWMYRKVHHGTWGGAFLFSMTKGAANGDGRRATNEDTSQSIWYIL